MNPFRHLVLPAAVAVLVLLFPGGSDAKSLYQLSPAGSGNFAFDHPSAVGTETAVHVVFVGDASGTGNFRLYYAAVDRNATFRDYEVDSTDFLLTAAVAIDNGAGYRNARHPQIALRSPGRLVVLFQAVPEGSSDGDRKLFRARITFADNRVTSQDVKEVEGPGSGRMAGDLVDPAFQLAGGGILRVVYADASSTRQAVYHAKVGIDNAAVAGDPVSLAAPGDSKGIRPVPRLALDENGWSHVVWAANAASSAPTPVYYALVRDNGPGAADNLAIGPSRVLYGDFRWDFPVVLVESSRSVYVLAADNLYDEPEETGTVAFTRLDPGGTAHDGSPVDLDDAAAIDGFILSHPGGKTLPGSYDGKQIDALFDAKGNLHVSSYGYYDIDTPKDDLPSRYYAVSLSNLLTTGTTETDPVPVIYPLWVASGDLAAGVQIPGDYTRASFVYYEGKTFHFWSGPDETNEEASDLYLTCTTDTPPADGCSVVFDPRNGERGRIPGAALLLLPAVLLLVRRAAGNVLGRR